MINDLAAEIHKNARDKGFWQGDITDVKVAERLALIHSEVSEALEAARESLYFTELAEDGKPEGFAVELADIIIRVLDLAEALEYDMEREIDQKMKYNASRPYKHGKRF